MNLAFIKGQKGRKKKEEKKTEQKKTRKNNLKTIFI